MNTESTFRVDEDGDEYEVEERTDGWYWRWTSDYAPTGNGVWFGPFGGVNECGPRT